MVRFFCASVAVLGTAISSPAAGSEFLGEFGSWRVYKNEDFCGAVKEFSGPGDTRFVLTKYVDGGVAASILNFNWSAKEGQKYEVAFSLADVTYRGTAVGVTHNNHFGFLTKLKPQFVDHFAKGTSLYVFLGETQIDQLSLSGTAAAVAAVERCLTKLNH